MSRNLSSSKASIRDEAKIWNPNSRSENRTSRARGCVLNVAISTARMCINVIYVTYLICLAAAKDRIMSLVRDTIMPDSRYLIAWN